MESIVSDALISHMKTNKLFTNKQFGFLKGRSATLQMLNVLEEWTKLLDSGSSVDVIYTDFQKAFDTVPHRRLLIKLSNYGIETMTLNWITSFLSNRKQRVVIKGEGSVWRDVISGVPQGSVLGPILFLIYINDIVDDLKCNAYLFADDMKIYNKVNSINDLDKLQKDIFTITTWTDKWLLKLNAAKCKVLSLGKDPGIQPHSYVLKTGTGDIKMSQSIEERDLGILVDSDLRFENHVMSKIKAANRIIGLIKRNFSHLDFESFLLLYKSMVRSHLEYAQTVWSPYKIKLIDAIEKVQRRATKILPGLKGQSYEQCLRRLRLPTLTYRRLCGDMIETFKIMQGYYDPEGVPTLQLSVYSGTRGHNKKLYKPQAHLDIRKFFFFQ